MKNRVWIYLTVLALLGSLTACGSSTDGGVKTSPLQAATPCINCHGNATSPGTGELIAKEWLGSAHKTAARGASCVDCHEPAPGHPNACNKCHSGATVPAQDELTRNPDAAGKCYKCHGPTATVLPLSAMPGDAHFFKNTSSASYVTSANTYRCTSCHNPHNNTLLPQHRQWALSAHAAVRDLPFMYYDFKTKGTTGLRPATSGAVKDDCVRCHTSTGFVNFVTSGFRNVSAWGVSSDKGRQVYYCNTCHVASNGRSYSYKVRTMPAAKSFYNFSTTKGKVLNVHSFPDLGASNLCMSCHVGRNSGSTIKAVAATGASMNDFSFQLVGLMSHYMSGGGTMFKTTGYEFYTSSQKYSNHSYYMHSSLGMNNFKAENGFDTGTAGPCVTCHVYPRNMTFLPVEKGSNGKISAIASPMCQNCHYKHSETEDYTWTVAKLQAEKDGFEASVEVLRQALETYKGVYFGEGLYPYLFKVPTTGANYNYGNAFISWGDVNTKGAAFNFILLSYEGGAWAHNDLYTKRLLYDSIDWLDNGQLDGSVENGINSLPTTPTVSAEVKAEAIHYLLGGPGGGRPANY